VRGEVKPDKARCTKPLPSSVAVEAKLSHLTSVSDVITWYHLRIFRC
jgi:hypothetical protein